MLLLIMLYYPGRGECSSKKICTWMLKVYFRISTILYQITAKNNQFGMNWVLFWPNFPKYTPFCKLDALGLEQKPTHQDTKNDEKAP